MSKINDKTQAPVSTALDFDKIDGARESITRRPVCDWPEFAGRDNSNKAYVVAGRLIELVKMNNPKGADRKDDFWWAAILEVTHAVKAKMGEETIDVLPELGSKSEVYVPIGSDQTDTAKHLFPLVGHEMMFWVALQPNGTLDVGAGKNEMKLFNVKIGETGKYAPIKRTGRYLLGGSTAKAAEVIAPPTGATPSQVAAARSTVSQLQG